MINMKFLRTTFTLLAICSTSRAQNAPPAYEDVMSALAADEIECGAFWNIVGICFESPTDDKSLSLNALKARDGMFARAAETTAKANLLAGTIDARNKYSQDLMMTKIGKNCRNVEILLADHGETCKRLAEDSTSRTIELLRETLGVQK
jgi:hypothetical protein